MNSNSELRARTWVVLCHPADPRNLGASIRAVVNHGLAGLRLVSQQLFDPGDLLHFSASAIHQVDLRSYKTLDEAISDCAQVVGTSRRTRDPQAPPFWPAAGFPLRLAAKGEIALLFGTERTGLTWEEVERCEALIQIPTTEAFPSMNLGHAVACMGYELARPLPEEVGPPLSARPQPRAAAEHRQAFYAKVREIAAEMDYPPGRNPDAFTRKLRKVLDRGNLSQADYGLFSGIFSELRRLYRFGGSGATTTPQGKEE